MSDITTLAGRVAGVISLAGFIPYIVAMFRRKTIPSLVSWWIWTVAGFMLLVSYYASGGNHSIWVPVTCFLGPLVTAILATWLGGKTEWEPLNVICLVGTGVGVILWWSFSSPELALAVTLCVDFLGCWDTFRHCYQKPEEESRLAWLLWLASNLTNLLAVEHWTPAVASYPVYLFTANVIINAILFFRLRNRAYLGRP